MLHAEPTKYGAGIELYGDYWDLKSLYDSISSIIETSSGLSNFSDFMWGLPYDIRHAFQKDRLIKTFGKDDYDKVEYRGVPILWPVFLSQIALLRWGTKFCPTTSEQHSNLYRLENCVENALTKYDVNIGKWCFEWVTSFAGFPTNYNTEFIFNMTNYYVCEGKDGKSRFKKLPEVLSMLSPISEEYKAFTKHLDMMAKEKGVAPEELLDLKEWPDFRW